MLNKRLLYFPFHTHSHFAPIVASGKAYSITFLKETFEKKKNKRIFGLTTSLLPKQSYITQNIIVHLSKYADSAFSALFYIIPDMTL